MITFTRLWQRINAFPALDYGAGLHIIHTVWLSNDCEGHAIVFCAYYHLSVKVSTFANKQISNEKDKGNGKNILLSVVLQHGGAFHDVLLVNWSNVNS